MYTFRPLLAASRPAFAALAGAIALLLSASCADTGSAESRSSPATHSRPIVAVRKACLADLSRDVALTAEFVPYQEVDIMSKVAGFIQKINVDIGDRVKTGQVLAVLEVPEMTDDLHRAAANVSLSEAEVKRAADDVHRAAANYEVAHLNFQRLSDAAKARPGLIAQQEIDDAKSKDLASEAQFSASQSASVAAQQHTLVNRAEESRFKTLFNYTRVLAPFDGVVTLRYASQGSMIQAGIASRTQAMPIVRLSQNNLLRLMLPVPESDVSLIHLGQTVQVHVSALNRSFPGKVARFSEKVTTSTRTMETEVDVPNPSLVLIPGMYASVDLRLESRPRVLSIPVAAVDLGSTEHQVYRVSETGAVEILPVKLGLETSNNVEVLSGLKAGDMVVVGDRAALKVGDKVTPHVIELSPKADS